jgi:hypothetical protein
MRIQLIVLITTLVTSTAAHAEHNFGAGVVLGDPTGLSFKYNINSAHSVDAALAWSDSINIHMHANFLWNKYKLFYLDQYPVDWYFGAGVRLREREKDRYEKDDDGLQLGLRAPIGLKFMFLDPRVEIFAETAVVFNFVPDTDADLDFGIGARYYF